MSNQIAPIRPVIHYIARCIAYESGMTLIAAAVVFSASSRTAVFPFLFAAGGVFCLWLMLYTMKAAARGDTFRYPYGTGRLENVCAILLAMIFAIGTLIPFVQVLQALWMGSEHSVQMGWTTLLLLTSAIGNGANSQWARWLSRKTESPILTSLHHLYHVGMVRDACSCAMIGLCWLFNGGNQTFMSRLDSTATIVLSIYSFYHFIPQIWLNFRALADFPLDESSQLKIMAILGKHFDSYDMIRHIYTTRRGDAPIFEVELGFDPKIPLADLLQREETMRQDFLTAFPNCQFRIIPFVVK